MTVPHILTNASVLTEARIPGVRSGKRIAWSADRLSLLAFDLEVSKDVDSGSPSIPICVMHPDSLQDHTMLHLIPSTDQSDQDPYRCTDGSESLTTPRLACLAWAPIGCLPTLLTATAQGELFTWSMVPSHQDVEQPLTVDEWHCTLAARVGNIYSAMWLAPRPLWHWGPASSTISQVHTLETHFQAGSGRSSLAVNANPACVSRLHWVRPGSLVLAAITTNGELRVVWRELGGPTGWQWRTSAAVPLLPAANLPGSARLAHTDVVTASDGSLHVLLGEVGCQSLAVVQVSGDPMAPIARGTVSHLRAALLTVVTLPPALTLLAAHLHTTPTGTSIEASLGDRAAGMLHVQCFQQHPEDAASWTSCQVSVQEQQHNLQSLTTCTNATFTARACMGNNDGTCDAWLTCSSSTVGSHSLPLSQKFQLPEAAAALALCPTGACVASLHNSSSSWGGNSARLYLTNCSTAAASLEPSAPHTAHEGDPQDQTRSRLSCLSRRLAWSLVSGCGGWGAEAAARALPPAQRREVMANLNGWLHAGPHFTRPHYAGLLGRLKLRMLRQATDPSGVRLTADLAAVAAWDAVGVAVRTLVPAGDTDAALVSTLQADGQQRMQMQRLLPWMEWTNSFVAYFIQAIRRWMLLTLAAEGVASSTEAAQAATAAAGLPAIRLVADAAFMSRALHTQGRLVVAAACLMPTSQRPTTAAALMNDPLAKRTQEQWSSLRTLLGLLKEHAPAPSPSAVIGTASAACASAAASFQGEDPLHVARPTAPITPTVMAKLLQSELLSAKGVEPASQQQLIDQAAALHLLPHHKGLALLGPHISQLGTTQAAAIVAALPSLPPLEPLLPHLQQPNTAMQPTWEPVPSTIGNSNSAPRPPAVKQKPAAWSVEDLRVGVSSAQRAGSDGAPSLRKLRWHAEALAAVGSSTPWQHSWVGRRDAINGAKIDDNTELLFEAADGSCTSAEFSARSGLGMLARPWLGANPLTGTPWKRRRVELYNGSEAAGEM